MSGFIQGVDRTQAILFPESVDDYVSEDNPVRVVDLFVDQLDLNVMGFVAIEAKATGRPSYHASILLKLVTVR